MTSDLPPPDLMDSSGRMRRLVISLGLGIGAAALSFVIADQMAEPDKLLETGHYARGAYKFVYYVTALAGAVVFLISLKILNHLADKKYRESLGPPQARKIER